MPAKAPALQNFAHALAPRPDATRFAEVGLVFFRECASIKPS